MNTFKSNLNINNMNKILTFLDTDLQPCANVEDSDLIKF